VAQVVAPVQESTSETTSETRTLTGGEALVAALKQNGVDTIFGLPGIQLDGFFDALYDERDSIRVIHTRHEQATAYMADGYARVAGREGVCSVVPGPGLLNAAAALSTAYSCNSPVLAVVGQIRSDLIDAGKGALHEIPNQIGLVRSVTKHAARATAPESVPRVVNEAFRQLRTGRPRPVEIEVPPDVLVSVADIALPPPASSRERFAGDSDLIDQAARLLGEASLPLIFAGGGVQRSGAGAELLALAEQLQAPIIVTQNGKGGISDRHYLAQGMLAEREYLPRADVILLAGTRWSEFGNVTRSLAPGQQVIQLDIDEEEIGRNTPVSIGIHADAKAGIAALANRVGTYNRRRPSREAELTAFKAAAAARINAIEPQAGFGLAIRAEVPDDGIIVPEFTQVGYWSFIGLPVYEPNTFLTPGYQGTLGYGFTAAMGAKVGKPNVPVVSINGDGGFGFTMNELSTLVHHDIRLVTIVFNDNAYGNVRRIQDEDFGGRVHASDLTNPNYQKLAEAFGITGRRAETAEELRIQLREAIRADEPTLIEVPVGVMPNQRKVLAQQ
jgi:acetolactate synthase I/II/III large subunit